MIKRGPVRNAEILKPNDIFIFLKPKIWRKQADIKQM